MYVVDVGESQDRSKENSQRNVNKAKLSWRVSIVLRLLCFAQEYKRRDGVRRTRCSAAIQVLYFLLDHMMRFPFWLILNYRYGLPFWFACVASFVVLNLTLYKWYFQLRDFVASIAFTELMSNETSRTKFLKVLKKWQFMILIICLFLFPTSYVGVWRSLQLNELDGPLWLQYSFLLSYPYCCFMMLSLQGGLSLGIAFGTNDIYREVIQTCLGDIRKVLFRVKESPGEQDDNFALNELSEIRRNAEARLHPFRRLSSILASMILVGFVIVIVMISAVLIPEQNETSKLLGLLNATVIGLTIFVSLLYCSAQQSKVFNENMMKNFHDCRLMKTYVRLFGSRRDFLDWLNESDLSATTILGIKLTNKLFQKFASIVLSLSGTIIYIAARQSK